ncbi:MAG: hypothetical protein ABSG50_15765 [Opitutaceae bacterium]
MSTPKSITEAPPAPNPEFITLPPLGGDSVCHLSRSWWYSAESKGLITLVRVRLPGRKRGRVLLPVPQALELIERLAAGEQRGGAHGGWRPHRKAAPPMVETTEAKAQALPR